MIYSKHRIGDLCYLVKGTSPTLKTPPGDYPLVVTASYRRTASTYQLEGPAVCVPLISSTGHGHAALHRVHYQEGRFALASLLVALMPKDPTVCSAKYLYHLLTAKKDDYFVPLMLGTANVSLKEKDIANVEIPIPSLNEQQRIVTRIEGLGARIKDARDLRCQTLEETDVLVPQAIATVFSVGKKHGWIEGPLGDYVVDDCYGTSEKTTDDDSGTPVLGMANIQNGRLDLRRVKYLHLQDNDRAKLLLRKGDILVNRTNSAELVGKSAVFDLDGQYAFASYLIRLRLDASRADPRLVAAYINSPIGRAYMFNEKKQMTGQANVNATKLKALPINLPPLDEQRRIVAYVDHLQEQMDALKALQAETSMELDALMPSILDEAFRG
jgi:type I restriction enzyme S subunit